MGEGEGAVSQWGGNVLRRVLSTERGGGWWCGDRSPVRVVLVRPCMRNTVAFVSCTTCIDKMCCNGSKCPPSPTRKFVSDPSSCACAQPFLRLRSCNLDSLVILRPWFKLITNPLVAEFLVAEFHLVDRNQGYRYRPQGVSGYERLPQRGSSVANAPGRAG